MTQTRRFQLFFITTAVFNMAANFAHPVTPTLINSLKLNDYMFGVAFASMMFTNFLMSPFWGRLNDYVSSRKLMLICCAGYGVAQIVFAVSRTELQIVMARMLAGIFTGGVFVCLLTYIVKEANPMDQGRYLTINATVQSVASAFGYLVGGFVGEMSVFLTFALQAVVLTLSGVVFFWLCKEENYVYQQKIPAAQLCRQSNPFKSFADCRLFMTPALLLLFLICIFMNFGNTAFDQSFNYYLKAELNLGSSYNGIIKAVVGIISLIANVTLCFWIITRNKSKGAMIVIMGVCTVISAYLFFPQTVVMLLVGGVLLYAANSVSIPILQDMIARRAAPAQKNLVMGFYNASKSLGSIAGSLTAGLIYSWNTKYPFACAALVFLLSLILGFRFYAREKDGIICRH